MDMDELGLLKAGYTALAVLTLACGGLFISWGWRMWRNPSRLLPDSRVYHQYILARYYSTPYPSYGAPQKLTERQVRSIAVRSIVGGILAILAAIGLFLGHL